MDNLEKYLPSKKFIASFLVIVILVSFFFTIKGVVVLFKNSKVSVNKGQTQVTVGTLVQKDSNNNGIPDWEEYLWGLNPKVNGESNKQFILSKKKTLTENGDITVTDDSQKISDNELLSRQFFATLISLQQSGQLDEGHKAC